MTKEYVGGGGAVKGCHTYKTNWKCKLYSLFGEKFDNTY